MLEIHGFIGQWWYFKESLPAENNAVQQRRAEVEWADCQTQTTTLKPVQPNWNIITDRAKRPHGGFIPKSSTICPQTSTVHSVRTSERKAKSRPTPTRRRQAEPGQTPSAAGILGPRPLPTSDHIIWEEAGLSPPSSVRVRPQTPTMRGGDTQIIPPNAEEQWKCADPKIKKSLGNQKRHLHLWHD